MIQEETITVIITLVIMDPQYSHNTLMIDDFPPMLSRGDLLIPTYYRKSDCNVTSKFTKEKNYH